MAMLRVRFSDEEFEAIKTFAKGHGKTVSAVVREAMNAIAIDGGQIIRVGRPKPEPALIHEGDQKASGVNPPNTSLLRPSAPGGSGSKLCPRCARIGIASCTECKKRG